MWRTFILDIRIYSVFHLVKTNQTLRFPLKYWSNLIQVSEISARRLSVSLRISTHTVFHNVARVTLTCCIYQSVSLLLPTSGYVCVVNNDLLLLKPSRAARISFLKKTKQKDLFPRRNLVMVNMKRDPNARRAKAGRWMNKGWALITELKSKHKIKKKSKKGIRNRGCRLNPRIKKSRNYKK